MGAGPFHMEPELQHGSMVGVALLLLLIPMSTSGFANLAEETLIKQHDYDKVLGQLVSLLSSPQLYCLSKNSIGGSFSASSHRCHHKQKHCLPIPQCGALSISPLLFHPHTKGSQIIMDTTQKAVKRQASFCNAITFSNRPIVIYEQVRLKFLEPSVETTVETGKKKEIHAPEELIWMLGNEQQVMRDLIILAPWRKSSAAAGAEIKALMAIFGTFCERMILRPKGITLEIEITKKQCCWSGALRLGFTSKDPSRINPDTLPKYACPDLVSQSGFWAKALPEEFANEGNIIAFWVDKKGRVFYRVNDSAAMLFFSGVRTAEPLWALIDVYGLTRGVQLL
ncbi:PREDICTED: E3 ubiquitin-protein ligase NEURL1-like, partial [Mesitornis unicolor]|uniref:E3 ubiquitin-protein ligase NEURL1-like n=1 Tax=Mesitornis unicolor TaxID=54374 RepID=UPI000529236C